MRSVVQQLPLPEVITALRAEDDVALPLHVTPIPVERGAFEAGSVLKFRDPVINQAFVINTPDAVLVGAVVVPFASPELLLSSTGVAEADELFAGLNPRHQSYNKVNFYGDFAASENYLLQ
tara:strand:- start:428 stop:790 length:363 start_codon:yes stop_codon:yes gene_type:complete